MNMAQGSLEECRYYLILVSDLNYGVRTRSKDSSRHSAFVALNGWSYHDNWLQNLLIASSRNGRRPAEKLATHKIR